MEPQKAVTLWLDGGMASILPGKREKHTGGCHLDFDHRSYRCLMTSPRYPFLLDMMLMAGHTKKRRKKTTTREIEANVPRYIRRPQFRQALKRPARFVLCSTFNPDLTKNGFQSGKLSHDGCQLKVFYFIL